MNFIGHLNIVYQYQSDNLINPLVDFEGSYIIYEELPEKFGTILSLELCYKITQLVPKGDDRKEFFRAIHAMTHRSYLLDYDCYKIGVCRNANMTNVHAKRPIDNLYDRIFLSEGNYFDFAEKDLVIYLDNKDSIKLHFGWTGMCWLKNHVKDESRKTLYEIGLVLYKHHQESNEMKNLEPTDARFNKIIFASHKSFLDNYYVPKQPKEQNKEDTNLYCYVGLQTRFDLGEYDDNEKDTIKIESIPLRNINKIARDLNVSFISHKVSFWSAICREYGEMYNDKSLSEKFEKINVYRGTSMTYSSVTISESYFESMETKHKIFIHTFGMILRNIQPYSIILLDIPDIFLEPRQTIFLINKLSEVCQRLSSVMIIN